MGLSLKRRLPHLFETGVPIVRELQRTCGRDVVHGRSATCGWSSGSFDQSAAFVRSAISRRSFSASAA